MQAVSPQPTSPFGGRVNRNLSYFLAVPLVAFVLVTLALAVVLTVYQSRHDGRIYTGVNVIGIDLSGMTPAEAETALTAALTYPQTETITLTYGEESWTKTPAELGLSLDTGATTAAALELGRTGGPIARLQETFDTWYYGRSLPPTLVLDESRLQVGLADVATAVEQPAQNAALNYNGETAVYAPGKVGMQLNWEQLQTQLLAPMTAFRQAQIELSVREVSPAVYDPATDATRIQQTINNPITFYLREPLDDLDLQPITLTQAQMADWIRIEVVTDANGVQQHEVFLDENAVRHWLSQYAGQIDREPVNARFYFDDDTRELVLVAPHVNGRKLDVEATLQQLVDQVGTPNRSIPFIVEEITPVAHSGATAAELGITELIREQTTWFYGSSDARKHNIARAAANFYGIVVAPYEEFSFNKYLGSISEADGYEEGLIIVGGQTIRGIGGGVCQVSTTMYQTAFWSGFPIVERWEHGYWLSYYNDGEGPGMDATVYSPIVDLRFVNNTPHHLLIENYYNEELEALTFKFYSTSMGRTVEKEGPFFENVTEVPGPEEDQWKFDPDLPPGTVEQIDWATEGADVTVRRVVKNADGDIIDDRTFESHYIPYPNTFHYGPDVEPYDYSLVPPDDRYDR